MSEDRTGRELAPRDETQIVPVEGGEQRGVERFSAGPRAHTVGLTEERAAQIVRQSGNARRVAFLAVLVVALFVPIYWFYDIGIPALGVESRLDKETNAQYVTDVSQGYALYIANCARCHDNPDASPGNGLGFIGPPLDEQAKLYNAVTADGLPGTGHLNPTYLENVLTVGGRYVCGDANSVMPTWAQPIGPLNYRQIEELIAWLTASADTTFIYTPPVAEGASGPAPTPVSVQGWRDPTWTPAPDASPVPACWRNPSGVIGGGGSTPAASGGPITPGTQDNPRVIKLNETASLTFTDDSGNQVTSIPVVAGEWVSFQLTNTAGFPHDFYIGSADDLQADNRANLQGTPEFSSGTQTVTFQVPDSTSAALQFGCTVPGHYQTMHGLLDIQPAGAGASSAPASAAPSAAPGSPAPSAAPASPSPSAAP
jgi:uncharacterized cupredoxin-like copper-binding protein/mono/diheme cytochrome c family protein